MSQRLQVPKIDGLWLQKPYPFLGFWDQCPLVLGTWALSLSSIKPYLFQLSYLQTHLVKPESNLHALSGVGCRFASEYVPVEKWVGSRELLDRDTHEELAA